MIAYFFSVKIEGLQSDLSIIISSENISGYRFCIQFHPQSRVLHRNVGAALRNYLVHFLSIDKIAERGCEVIIRPSMALFSWRTLPTELSSPRLGHRATDPNTETLLG